MSMQTRLRRTFIGLLLGLAVITLTLASAVAADCEFVLGFKTLRDLIGHEIVGECLENEHFSENGDSTQATTGGLLVWRNADNHTAFTDGNHTWINGPNGLQQRLNSERFPWEPEYAPGGGISTPTATPTPQPATARATGSAVPNPTSGVAFSSPWPGSCASFSWHFQYSTTEEASAVTGYQISRRKPEFSGEDTFSVLATVSDTSYQDCGLKDGVVYQYEIRAKNDVGVSELELTLTGRGESEDPIEIETPTPTPLPVGNPTPTPTPAPEEVPRPYAVIVTSSPWPGKCVSFSWTFNFHTAEELEAVTGYQVSRRKPEVSGEDSFSVHSTVTGISFAECNPEVGVLFEYEVKAKNDVGVSSFGATHTHRREEEGSPTPTPTPLPVGSPTPTPTPTPTPVGPPPPPPPTPTPTPTPVGPPPPPPTPTPTPTPVGPPPPPPRHRRLRL